SSPRKYRTSSSPIPTARGPSNQTPRAVSHTPVLPTRMAYPESSIPLLASLISYPTPRIPHRASCIQHQASSIFIGVRRRGCPLGGAASCPLELRQVGKQRLQLPIDHPLHVRRREHLVRRLQEAALVLLPEPPGPQRPPL